MKYCRRCGLIYVNWKNICEFCQEEFILKPLKKGE